MGRDPQKKFRAGLKDNDQRINLFMQLQDNFIGIVSLWYISDIDEGSWRH
jgi:hypothetical protein